MTREATLSDIPAILAMTRDIHEKTHYRDLPISVGKFQRTLRMMMNSKQHLVLVADDEKDGAVGFLLGVTQEHFVIIGKFATDLMVYAKPDHPGVGARLVRRFLVWAREKPDVHQIIMGISNDLVDEKRLGAFYERQGLRRMGGIYIETLDRIEQAMEVAS